MTATKSKSRILAEVHETARGLHGEGLISKRRMGEFDALCDLGVEPMSPEKIKALRTPGPGQPGSPGGGAQHQRVDGSKMGGRRQKAQRPLAQAAESDRA